MSQEWIINSYQRFHSLETLLFLGSHFFTFVFRDMCSTAHSTE